MEVHKSDLRDMEVFGIILACVEESLETFKDVVTCHNEIRDVILLELSLQSLDVLFHSDSELEALDNVLPYRGLESLIASSSCCNNLIMNILRCCNECTIFSLLNNLKKRLEA
jgi:hypothetical protein